MQPEVMLSIVGLILLLGLAGYAIYYILAGGP